ncbi:hypothetical protein [Opitutus terrae]|uniref:hypothetical protein n=1 Tax=Opitutus terrae TaxID=107709 RepID=UPI0011D03819|nr:hypothetical protein [Opitutus terrae]
MTFGKERNRARKLADSSFTGWGGFLWDRRCCGVEDRSIAFHSWRHSEKGRRTPDFRHLRELLFCDRGISYNWSLRMLILAPNFHLGWSVGDCGVGKKQPNQSSEPTREAGPFWFGVAFLPRVAHF